MIQQRFFVQTACALGLLLATDCSAQMTGSPTSYSSSSSTSTSLPQVDSSYSSSSSYAGPSSSTTSSSFSITPTTDGIPAPTPPPFPGPVECEGTPASEGLTYLERANESLRNQAVRTNPNWTPGIWTKTQSGGTWTYSVSKGSSYGGDDATPPPPETVAPDAGTRVANFSLIETWKCGADFIWRLQTVVWTDNVVNSNIHHFDRDELVISLEGEYWLNSQFTAQGYFDFTESKQCPVLSISSAENMTKCYDQSCNSVVQVTANSNASQFAYSRNMRKLGRKTESRQGREGKSYFIKSESEVTTGECLLGANQVKQTGATTEDELERVVMPNGAEVHFDHARKIGRSNFVEQTELGSEGHITEESEEDGTLTQRTYSGDKSLYVRGWLVNSLAVRLEEFHSPNTGLIEELSFRLGNVTDSFQFGPEGTVIVDDPEQFEEALDWYDEVKSAASGLPLSPSWPEVRR